MKNIEIDQKIFKKVMRWEPRPVCGGYKPIIGDFNPTTNIAHALDALRAMINNQHSNFFEWNFELTCQVADGVENWCAIIERDHFKNSPRHISDSVSTPEMAICLAILEAVGVFKPCRIFSAELHPEKELVNYTLSHKA